ncbi:uncharacterized protein LOC104653965 [Rhinopithecus roxellana]|uniref:uncharacterized protein LOC104653965 n=1 Tax=Rhinopithecus roxellana TaxID=61622 RepID=UPI0012374FDC|nr:uncharacterized protein LOC104653965 [Rhinopithecus roxellana]
MTGSTPSLRALIPEATYPHLSSQTPGAYPDPTAQALTPRQESPFLVPKELTLRRTFPLRQSAGPRSAARNSAAQTQNFLWVRPGGPRSGPSSLPSLEAGVPRPTQRPPSLPPGSPRAPVGAASGAGLFRRTPFSRTSKTGYLVHALQTTLWTCSLLFKSPTGERGKKKIQRRSKSIGRKNFKRVSTEAEKAQALPTFKLQQSFQENAETASHPDLTSNPHTPATVLLFQAERTPTPPPGGPLPGAGQLQRLFMAFHRWRLPPTLLLAL